ncbi:WecB/TagA/CpsF family glycosyltransferase [Aliigemmobacter aestuarii]|uniref:WecB/TagA/CpsF family glycosyltransferase n=1 Tax=Aliigemmobacter aestuarii TaxID=1445661 RepID=UPI001FEB1F83|nr:WecB/TagA/CpsF family glycosyltransferase [Gemmobacter aestuarii]
MEFQFDTARIGVNLPDRQSVLTAVRDRFERRQGFALATINLDHLVKLARSPAFRQAYAAQDLVCADGNPIVWLSRLARRPVSLVPGSDLVIPLARLAAETGIRVALVGTTDAALDAAAARLRYEAPGLSIVATIAPPMGFDPDGEPAAAILSDLAARDVGLCFLALGAPRQEALAARGRSLAPATGFASIGAGLDFLAGSQQRAPQWVRRIAMEWAWRMLSAPRRLVSRYAACAAILPGQAAAALALRRRTR